MKYEVQVIEKATGTIDRISGPSGDKRHMDKIARGVAINLNHDDFRVQVIELKEETNVRS